MIEINFFYFLVFFLSLIQSFVGVGVLVLGTPILLILDFKLFDIMITLLPISILTSIISILFIKKKQKVFFYDDTLKYFLIICLPAMFVGLKIVNNFGNLINFNILVGLVILFSLIIKLKFQKIEILNNQINKILIFFIGVVHGLSNSGGTLLSVFFVKKKVNSYLKSLYNIHYFYFLLALSQLIILFFISNSVNYFDVNFLFLLMIIILSVFIGIKYLIKYHFIGVSLIYILASISAITLLIV